MLNWLAITGYVLVPFMAPVILWWKTRDIR
jgi:hypothetical protein